MWHFELGGKLATNQRQGLEVSDWLRTNLARNHPNQSGNISNQLGRIPLWMKYLETSGRVVYPALLTPKIGEGFHSVNLPYKYTLVRNFVFK